MHVAGLSANLQSVLNGASAEDGIDVIEMITLHCGITKTIEFIIANGHVSVLRLLPVLTLPPRTLWL